MNPTDTPKRLSDVELAKRLRRYVNNRMPFNDGSRLMIEAADAIERLSTPPSQGKVERARDAANAFYEHIKHGDEKHRAWLKEECDGKLSDLITQALTESSGQTDPEAAAILRTLGCVPDSTDLSETDARVSVGFLRRLIESSGQGTDGACCEAMREACALKVLEARLHTDICTCDWCYALKTAAAGIRALPLPVSADGREYAAIELLKEILEEVNDADRAVSSTTRIKLRAFLKSKQPSDTGSET